MWKAESCQSLCQAMLTGGNDKRRYDAGPKLWDKVVAMPAGACAIENRCAKPEGAANAVLHLSGEASAHTVGMGFIALPSMAFSCRVLFFDSFYSSSAFTYRNSC